MNVVDVVAGAVANVVAAGQLREKGFRVRSAWIVALLCLFVAPLHAASGTRPAPNAATSLAKPHFKRVAHDPERLQRLLGDLRGGRIESSAVIMNGATMAVVIPAAGNAPGANGTYFRSDVTLVNMLDVDQDAVIIWLPNGQPEAAVDFEGVIAHGWPVTYRDFVGSELELTGVGALLIVALDSAGEIDLSAAIDAYSRIWSPSAGGAAGTFSQPFEGVDTFHLADVPEAMMLGLRQDEGFRTNYGIVNMGESDQMFSISVINDDGIEVATTDALVRPGEMILRPLPAGDFGNISILVTVDTAPGPSANVWTTFASSTDNTTGDGWVSIGGSLTPLF